MARAVFKAWFVDFLPVKAKMARAASFPGMDAETFALFPDALDEIEGWLTPRGWRRGYLSDVLHLAYGKSLPERDRVPGEYPVYGSGGTVGTHTSCLVPGPGIIVGRKGTIGSLTWAVKDFYPIDTTYFVLPEAPEYSLVWLYRLLETLELGTRNNDSAVPGLNREDAYRQPVHIPARDALMAFTRLAEPLKTMGHALEAESRTLAATRDLLLPRLLSGES
jgi:type I restriction enzyme S subunit